MTQLPVRPNLIVQRREVTMPTDVSKLVAVMCADLVRHIAGVSAIDRQRSDCERGPANMTIDDDASLAYQQKSKSLGPTVTGAFKALCPAGFG